MRNFVKANLLQNPPAQSHTSSHAQQHPVCCWAAPPAHIVFCVCVHLGRVGLILWTALLQGCTTCTICSPTPSCT